MLALQFGGLRHAGLQLDGEVGPVPLELDRAEPGAVTRVVRHHYDAALDAQRDEVDEQFLRLGGFQAVEVEVLVAHDGAGGVVDHRVVVDAQVVRVALAVPAGTVRLDIGAGVLVPQVVLLGRARAGEPAGDAGGMPLQRVQAVQFETLGGVFGFADFHLAVGALGHLHLHRSHHCLTVEAAQARLAVVEDVPLPVYLAEAAVGVAARRGRVDGLAVIVHVASAGVDHGAAVGPGTQRVVAPGPGQGVVRLGQTEVAVRRPAAVHEDVFVLHLADRRGLEEAELALLTQAGNHIPDGLRALFDRAHRLRVELGAEGALEAPVAVDASVVVDEGGGVEAQHAHGPLRILGVPVAHGKGAVRPVRVGNHRIAPGSLGVGVQVIGLLAVRGDLFHDIGCVEDVPLAVGVEGIAVGVQAGLEDHTVVAPVQQVVHRGGPDHLVAAAVRRDLDVVRAVDIDAVLSRVVGILKHVGFAVGDVFPEGKIRIGGTCGNPGAQQSGAGERRDQTGEELAIHTNGFCYQTNILNSPDF